MSVEGVGNFFKPQPLGYIDPTLLSGISEDPRSGLHIFDDTLHQMSSLIVRGREADPIFSEGARILVIDSNIDDANLLAKAAENNGTIVLKYDATSTNSKHLLTIIASRMHQEGYHRVDNIAFANHASAGRVALFSDIDLSMQTINNGNVQAFWQGLGSIINKEGRIDLLGCNLAFSDDGGELINSLENISLRNVAASVNPTGDFKLRGDWILETDNVNVSSLYFDLEELSNWKGTLQEDIPSLAVPKNSSLTDIITEILSRPLFSWQEMSFQTLFDAISNPYLSAVFMHNSHNIAILDAIEQYGSSLMSSSQALLNGLAQIGQTRVDLYLAAQFFSTLYEDKNPPTASEISISRYASDPTTDAISTTITLQSTDLKGDDVEFLITSLPANATLVDVSSGDTITAANTVLSGNQVKLTTTPGTTTSYEFGYKAQKSISYSVGGQSYSVNVASYNPSTVSLELSTEDTTPITASFSQNIDSFENLNTTIYLQGIANSGTIEKYTITSLPERGILQQYDGTPITSENTDITDSQGRVVYVPVQNYYGEDFGSFNFTTTSSLTTTTETTATNTTTKTKTETAGPTEQDGSTTNTSTATETIDDQKITTKTTITITIANGEKTTETTTDTTTVTTTTTTTETTSPDATIQLNIQALTAKPLPRSAGYSVFNGDKLLVDLSFLNVTGTNYSFDISQLPSKGKLYNYNFNNPSDPGSEITESNPLEEHSSRFFVCPDNDGNYPSELKYKISYGGDGGTGFPLNAPTEGSITINVIAAQDSPLPISSTVPLYSNSERTISLISHYTDKDVSSLELHSNYYVTSLPTNGKLYQTDNTEITEINTKVTDIINRVVFVPYEDYSVSDPNDDSSFPSFTYNVELHGQTSDNKEVKLQVLPLYTNAPGVTQPTETGTLDVPELIRLAIGAKLAMTSNDEDLDDSTIINMTAKKLVSGTNYNTGVVYPWSSNGRSVAIETLPIDSLTDPVSNNNADDQGPISFNKDEADRLKEIIKKFYLAIHRITINSGVSSFAISIANETTNPSKLESLIKTEYFKETAARLSGLFTGENYRPKHIADAINNTQTNAFENKKENKIAEEITIQAMKAYATINTILNAPNNQGTLLLGSVAQNIHRRLREKSEPTINIYNTDVSRENATMLANLISQIISQ